jgi:hemolysin activation/secretion protein
VWQLEAAFVRHAPSRAALLTAVLSCVLLTSPMASAQPASPTVTLRGFVLVDDKADLRRDGVATFSGVDTTHAPEISAEEAGRILHPFLGRPVDMGLLQDARQALQSYFQAIHEPFTGVIVPPQVVDSGVVQMVILVSKLGKLNVDGNEWFDADQYRDSLHLRPGEPIDGAGLNADVDWINRNQYRHATAEASPGEAVGTTDITIRTKEDLPFSFTGGIDNTGTEATDLYRWNAGFDWGNAFWRGDDFSYRFTASPDIALLQEHSFGYSTDLPWRATLSIQGSYSTSNVQTDSIIGNSGVTDIVSLKYSMPLPALSWLTHHLTVGYDFKSTNNNILFGGFTVFSTTSEVDQFSFDYGAQIPDALGSTGVDADLVFSPGGMTGRNTDAVFATQVPGGQAEYFYAHLSAERITDLSDDWSWDVRATLQLSADALLPSEQIVLGGFASVRGYQDQAATRDNGYLIENELRAPPVRTGLPAALGLGMGEALVPFAFLDYGAGWNHFNGPAVGSWVSLASIGPGVTYQVGKVATIRFTWGFPLGHQGQSVPRLGPQFGVQFTL